jgi:hypothetical protein
MKGDLRHLPYICDACEILGSVTVAAPRRAKLQSSDKPSLIRRKAIRLSTFMRSESRETVRVACKTRYMTSNLHLNALLLLSDVNLVKRFTGPGSLTGSTPLWLSSRRWVALEVLRSLAVTASGASLNPEMF